MGNKANFSESLLQEDADRFLEREKSVSVDYCHRQESGFSILETAEIISNCSIIFDVNCLVHDVS